MCWNFWKSWRNYLVTKFKPGDVVRRTGSVMVSGYTVHTGTASTPGDAHALYLKAKRKHHVKA